MSYSWKEFKPDPKNKKIDESWQEFSKRESILGAFRLDKVKVDNMIEYGIFEKEFDLFINENLPLKLNHQYNFPKYEISFFLGRENKIEISGKPKFFRVASLQDNEVEKVVMIYSYDKYFIFSL